VNPRGASASAHLQTIAGRRLQRSAEPKSKVGSGLPSELPLVAERMARRPRVPSSTGVFLSGPPSAARPAERVIRGGVAPAGFRLRILFTLDPFKSEFGFLNV
jgi:hypothetical protein